MLMVSELSHKFSREVYTSCWFTPHESKIPRNKQSDEFKQLTYYRKQDRLLSDLNNHMNNLAATRRVSEYFIFRYFFLISARQKSRLRTKTIIDSMHSNNNKKKENSERTIAILKIRVINC